MALKIWMRAVGVLYLAMFVAAAIIRAPIRTLGVPGTLERAAAGDATAKFLVDTWFALGVEFATVGVALLVGSRAPARARSLVYTVLGIETVRAAVTDLHWIVNGYDLTVHGVWIAIHSVVVATGVIAVRRTP